nr:MinD/ParA family protein [Thermomonospora echinospora]
MDAMSRERGDSESPEQGSAPPPDAPPAAQTPDYPADPWPATPPPFPGQGPAPGPMGYAPPPPAEAFPQYGGGPVPQPPGNGQQPPPLDPLPEYGAGPQTLPEEHRPDPPAYAEAPPAEFPQPEPGWPQGGAPGSPDFQSPPPQDQPLQGEVLPGRPSQDEPPQGQPPQGEPGLAGPPPPLGPPGLDDPSLGAPSFYGPVAPGVPAPYPPGPGHEGPAPQGPPPGPYGPGLQGPAPQGTPGAQGPYGPGPEGFAPQGPYAPEAQGPGAQGPYGPGPEGSVPQGPYGPGFEGSAPQGPYDPGSQGSVPQGPYGSGPQGSMSQGPYGPGAQGPGAQGPYGPGFEGSAPQGTPGVPGPYGPGPQGPVPPQGPPLAPLPPVQEAPRPAVPQTADSLSAETLLRGRRNAPTGGWRKMLYKATGGAIHPGESPAELRRRELVARASTPVAGGHHRVAVMSLKGGVGKTTTTVGLGATLASLRGDRVIAVDANPDRGTLSDKVRLETAATVRDLLNERDQIQRYADVRAFTSQATSRLEVLASDRDPAVSEAFSADDYRAVAEVLEHFYSICLTDCGTGLLHSAMAGVLSLANQLVLVSSPSVDGARSASATLDWLEAHDHGDLVRNGVVVLSMVRARSKSTVDLDRLQAHFESRCRGVVRIPYDDHLEEGAEVELDLLSPECQDAYLQLAAVVGDGFAWP